jgi:pilus assembly protein CpaE
MLRAAVISERAEQRHLLQSLAESTRHILLLEAIGHYPHEDELRRLGRAHAPQVVFLDFESRPDEAGATAQRCLKSLRGAILVGLLDDPRPERIMSAVRDGAREIFYAPFEPAQFQEMIARVEEAARQAQAAGEASEQVYSFFPAKAGDGCSVVAANAAMHLARMPDSSVLLADLDLSAGVTRFLLKLSNGFSATDALERMAEMDPAMWNEIVAEAGPLAVLGSGELRKPMTHLAARVRQLVDFARRQYRCVCLDLSGQFDELTLEAIQESRKAFLVLTPDLASVYLAREKLRFLRSLDLESRVEVILNRWQRDAAINTQGIEEVLGLPVDHTFPEDRAAVNAAVMKGQPVEAASALGKELVKLAYALSDARVLRHAAEVKRQVEYFALLPGEYTLLPGSSGR